MKWHARTCEVTTEGVPSVELRDFTLKGLLSQIDAQEANHWVIWNGDRYKETLTTLWFSPGDDRFREMFSLHNDHGKPSAPKPPKDAEELERQWWEDQRYEIEDRLRSDRHKLERAPNVYHEITARISIRHFSRKLKKIPT